jgi:exodeoxyribonuclease-3
MKLITWNINSLRLRLPLLAQLVADENPDVICLQETKCPDDAFPHLEIAALGYDHRAIWGQKSYNGVAILSKLPLANVQNYARCAQQDCRHLSATLPDGLVVHNIYLPAGGYEADTAINPKFQHKLDFVDDLAALWREQKPRRSVMVGDLNIAPLEHDVWDSKKMQKTVSHTPIEREKFLAMQRAGDWVDAVRAEIPEPQKLYTWWTYRQPDWEAADKGRRLDHIWATPDVRTHGAAVLRAYRAVQQPSDHVPIIIHAQ